MEKYIMPTDGPEAVLGRVTKLLRLRYSNTFVGQVVAGHPRPNSLLALVEVAPTFGLKMTPGKTEATELDRLRSPTIVHFGSGEAGGFGVFEGASADGFKVWDGKHGLRSIEQSAFLEGWSGIVAVVERDDSTSIPEPNYLRTRILEIIFGTIEPPAVVGSSGATWIRTAFGVLLASLLVLALLATPVGLRLAAGAIIALSIVGLAVTVIAGISSVSQTSPLSSRLCARGRYVNCMSALSSRYSRIFGFPLTDLGIALYAALLLLISVSAAVESTGAIWEAVRFVYLVTVPFSLVLICVEIALRQLCMLCLAVHSVNLLGATVALVALAPEYGASSDVPAIALFALFYGVVLLFAIPMFSKHRGLAVVRGMHRRITASPFASLAEILTERPTKQRAERYAVALGGPDARHELTVFVHPFCSKCDSVFGEVRDLVQAGLVKAFVGLAPRNQEEADHRGCTAVVAAGLGAVTLDTAYAAAKKDLLAVMGSDPVRALSTALSVERAVIDAHLAQARALVNGAQAFVDEHAGGTPAVFVDSRLYRGELSHLGFLLQEHPDLLDPTLLPAENAKPELRLERGPLLYS